MSGSNFNSTTVTPVTGLTLEEGWFKNVSIVKATTTNANDSIKITSADGTAFSATNIGFVNLPDPSNPSRTANFSITADVTILLTGAHWGHGTTGDIVGALLRVLAINEAGVLRWGVTLLGGRHTLLIGDTSATQSNAVSAHRVLSTVALSSATNSCREIGFFRANFDDTGGAAEDLWAIQTGVNDVVTGQTADGFLQNWNATYVGFLTDPTPFASVWYQVGHMIFAEHIYSVRGTSNSTLFTMSLPAVSNSNWDGLWTAATNNTIDLVVPGRVYTTNGNATAFLRVDVSGTAWTAVGTKAASWQIVYKAGPSASFID